MAGCGGHCFIATHNRHQVRRSEETCRAEASPTQRGFKSKLVGPRRKLGVGVSGRVRSSQFEPKGAVLWPHKHWLRGWVRRWVACFFVELSLRDKNPSCSARYPANMRLPGAFLFLPTNSPIRPRPLRLMLLGYVQVFCGYLECQSLSSEHPDRAGFRRSELS